MLHRNRYFGKYGGSFSAETLVPLLIEIEEAFEEFKKNRQMKEELEIMLKNYAGRPTPLFYAKNLSKKIGIDVFLKREDLLHTGAHKINNALGQMMLARMMGKKRVIAETGAGQHGVATATAAAYLGFECMVFMGEEDIKRQAPNVRKMKLLGAEVIPVKSGSKTLKDAINEALRFWIANAQDTYYLIGSVVGPHPYPRIVRYFQSVIGRETKIQFKMLKNRLPEALVACVGGGSNAAGFFYPFIDQKDVKLFGVEAGGSLKDKKKNSASLNYGKPGIFQGCLTYVLQDKSGSVLEAHSVAPGLDYPAVGPEHSFWKDTSKVEYGVVYDEEALEYFEILSKEEGIIPALESAHAVAFLEKLAKKGLKEAVVCLSGRGDKDLETFFKIRANSYQ
ncbi:MAG: tryptophan synthase subunit beta [Actinobacteria bacterium]|nr:tryptophan synthase subunit beta [Actinomycetota bacterium]